MESVLDATVIRVKQTDVEQVLKLSYSSPGSAVKFFRWAGLQLNDKHSPYSWNLVVDLLEGWEKEMNVASARTTFADMVSMVGWDPRNVPAYDTFLSTLLMGYDGLREAMKHFDTMKDRGCFPGVKFFRLALEECLKCNDVRAAMLIWETLVARVGFRPDIQLYNLMIAIHCYDNQTDIANKFLDEMIYNGVFPDSQTYNVLFQYLIKYKKLKEASFVLNEMIKNEFFPNITNCNAAIKA